jgi:hypothetical protein
MFDAPSHQIKETEKWVGIGRVEKGSHVRSHKLPMYSYNMEATKTQK